MRINFRIFSFHFWILRSNFHFFSEFVRFNLHFFLPLISQFFLLIFQFFRWIFEFLFIVFELLPFTFEFSLLKFFFQFFFQFLNLLIIIITNCGKVSNLVLRLYSCGQKKRRTFWNFFWNDHNFVSFWDWVENVISLES